MAAAVTAIVQTANMAETIGQCLETLRWVDDLLVIDDESTDGTREICQRDFGARVLVQKRENAAAHIIEHDVRQMMRRRHSVVTQLTRIGTSHITN